MSISRHAAPRNSLCSSRPLLFRTIRLLFSRNNTGNLQMDFYKFSLSCPPHLHFTFSRIRCLSDSLLSNSRGFTPKMYACFFKILLCRCQAVHLLGFLKIIISFSSIVLPSISQVSGYLVHVVAGFLAFLIVLKSFQVHFLPFRIESYM